MKKTRIILRAFADAVITAIYVILIGFFIRFSEEVLENNPGIFFLAAMLMLLVFSAAFTGFLIFGKPVMLYLDNKKKEAISLLGYTLIFLFIITLIILLLLVIIY